MNAEIGMQQSQWVAEQQMRVEQALAQCIPEDAPVELTEAMQYAVLGGGKRLRPLLVLASAHAVNAGQIQAALRAACAVELIHAYSLVHDDMPCMDNDTLRRGKPTTHIKYGQALAMLTGDALQALAFEVLTPDDSSISLEQQARLVRSLAKAAGARGMAGGQATDLLNVGHVMDESALQAMHQRKTGALLCASIEMGILCSPHVVPTEQVKSLMLYAQSMGLAFQIVDDVLDVTAQSADIGKTAGKDADLGKPTYVSVLGVDAAQACVNSLYDKAMQALDQSGLKHIEPLQMLANLIVQRSY